MISPSNLEIGNKIASGSFGTVQWARCFLPKKKNKYRNDKRKNRISEEEEEEVVTVVSKTAHTNVPNAALYLETEMYLNRRLCDDNIAYCHPNIAPYLGECIKDGGEKHLIWYASGSGKTLEDFLEPTGCGEKKESMLALLARSIGIDDFLGTPHCIHSLAREVLRQILSGLSYCHSKGIVHRDIKPANILVDDVSKCLRIIDFGSAADMSSIFDRKGYRGTDKGVRSLLYCAPEEFVEEDYPYAFDVYSAAVCWLRLMVPGLNSAITEEEFFQFRIDVRNCQHDLEKWHDMATTTDNVKNEEGKNDHYHQQLNENNISLPQGWKTLFDSTEEGKDAFALLVKLMRYKPSHRITASEALLEPYLNPTCTEPIRPIPPVSKPWSIKSHMEKWNTEQKEHQREEYCEIPNWFFDDTISIELNLPLLEGLILKERVSTTTLLTKKEEEKDSNVKVTTKDHYHHSIDGTGGVIVENYNDLEDIIKDTITYERNNDEFQSSNNPSEYSLLAIGQSIVKDATLSDVKRILDQWPEKSVPLEFIRR